MALRFVDEKPLVANAVSKPLANALVNALPTPAPIAEGEGAVSANFPNAHKGKRKRKVYADGHAIVARRVYMRDYMRKRRLQLSNINGLAQVAR